MCVCVVGEGDERQEELVCFVHIGNIHGGLESKCPIVTIIESVWGLFYGDYFNQFWLRREWRASRGSTLCNSNFTHFNFVLDCEK